MMSKTELEALIEKYEGKAKRAYRNYQDTGITRYDWERRNAEKLASAFRMAADSADEHAALIAMKSELCYLANCARRADTEEKAKSVLRELVSYAGTIGLIQKDTE